MPKRIIDGEGLWTSHKLAMVEPEWMRAEYANLLPLALANGVFECDPMLVWRTVYSYNRPSITTDLVVNILSEFERVGLIKRFSVDGKPWAFITGITKSGRLPSAKRVLQRHEAIGPQPPESIMDAISQPQDNHETATGQPSDSQWAAKGWLGNFGSSGNSGSSGGVYTRKSALAKPHLLTGISKRRTRSIADYSQADGEIFQAAKWACQELSLAGNTVWVLYDTIAAERKYSTEPVQAIAEMLVRIRRSYESVPHKNIVYDGYAFFARGIWKQSSLYEHTRDSHHDSIVIDKSSYEPEVHEPEQAICIVCGKLLGPPDPDFTGEYVCSQECLDKRADKERIENPSPEPTNPGPLVS